jgi:hypothetical protein
MGLATGSPAASAKNRPSIAVVDELSGYRQQERRDNPMEYIAFAPPPPSPAASRTTWWQENACSTYCLRVGAGRCQCVPSS